MGRNTPIVSPKLRSDRILLHTAPLRPRSLRSIPKERRLGRRDAGGPVLGNVRSIAVRRLTIMAMASMRPGPQA